MSEQDRTESPPARRLERFLDHLRDERRLSPHTVLNYRRDLRQALGWLQQQGMGDRADWAEPRLVGPAGEKKLTDLKWKSATAGWGQIRIGKNAGGGSGNG